jgi:hypothetical protein
MAPQVLTLWQLVVSGFSTFPNGSRTLRYISFLKRHANKNTA